MSKLRYKYFLLPVNYTVFFFQVRCMIMLLSLQEYENILSSNLSGGNRRKLSVGIALIGNPSIILVN